MPEPVANSGPFTVYYDGACPVCDREIAVYRKANGAEQLSWIDASSADPQLLGGDLDAELALARMHVRDESGQLISGAAAFAAIWQRLPRTRLLGRFLGSAPALMILEPGYSLFLKFRRFWR